MLSSPFDRLTGGGNALPKEVYGGGYKQDIWSGNNGGGSNAPLGSRKSSVGRGESFVKMNVERKVFQRSGREQRKRLHGQHTGGNGQKRVTALDLSLIHI